jgi:hypothetical protein
MSREHWIVLVGCVLWGGIVAARMVWSLRQKARRQRAGARQLLNQIRAEEQTGQEIDRIIGGGR